MKDGTIKPQQPFLSEDINLFHVGHKTLVAESIKRTGQCCIALRDVAGTDDSNPYDFERVKGEIHAACVEFGDKIKVVELPNITDVFLRKRCWL